MLSTCFYLIVSFFKKQKEVSSSPLCLIFCIISNERYSSRYIISTDQISLNDCLYLLKYRAICDIISFGMNLNLLIEPFFLHNQRIKIKMQIYQERKALLTWNKRNFSSFSRAFSCQKFSQTRERTFSKIFHPTPCSNFIPTMAPFKCQKY